MKNILLIEDEDNLNRGISLKLQKEGYTVFSAATVAEGLSLFQANTIDLVICDIGLPDGSGLDLCASIRQKSDVLFLFLTALDTEVDMITGYPAFSFVLQKSAENGSLPASIPWSGLGLSSSRKGAHKAFWRPWALDFLRSSATR